MPIPALSVLLPNYNHAEFLPKCIEAILEQSFTNFELIIVDDCSTDNSMDVIRSYARSDSRIRVEKNPVNKGVIATLCRALELARADYVFGAAADDYSLPGFFEKSMELLRRYPEAGLCVGQTECVNEVGTVKIVVPGLWSEKPAYLSPSEVASKITSCGVPGPTIWKRSAFLEAGNYRHELRWHGDWFPLHVIAFRYGVCFLPMRTNVVREVPESYSSNQHRGAEQRIVLQSLLGLMAQEKYRDVIDLFRESGIFRQFGPELIRAAATANSLDSVLLPVLREHVLAHAPSLMRELEADVRAGVARLLGRYGRDAFIHYRALGERKKDPDQGVITAATQARREIRRALPLWFSIKYHTRATLGTVMRAFDQTLHPLHHQRMSRIEQILTEMAEFQKKETYMALSALYHQLEALKKLSSEQLQAQQPIPRIDPSTNHSRTKAHAA